MNSPERNYGTAPEFSVYMLHRGLMLARKTLGQFFDPPAEMLETNAQIALDSAQIYTTSSAFEKELKEIRSTFTTRNPQELSIDVVESYAYNLIISGGKELKEQKNYYAFVEAMDIATGILGVTSGFLNGYSNKDVSPEDIKGKTDAFQDQPGYLKDEILNEFVKECILINKDPSGFRLIDHLVALTVEKSQTNTQQGQDSGLVASVLNPKLAIAGAQIAEKIYKASYSMLTNNE